MKMQLKAKILFGIIACCAAISPLTAWSEEIWIVSSKAFPEASITLSQVKDAYLDDYVALSGGNKIQALDRKKTDSNLRAKFYMAAAGMTVTQLKSFWSRRVFTGRGHPPPIFESLDSLKKELTGNPLAISFIEPSEIDSSMRTLLKIEIKTPASLN